MKNLMVLFIVMALALPIVSEATNYVKVTITLTPAQINIVESAASRGMSTTNITLTKTQLDILKKKGANTTQTVTVNSIEKKHADDQSACTMMVLMNVVSKNIVECAMDPPRKMH